MLRPLVVLLTVLAAVVCATIVSAEPAAAHTCSVSGEVTVDPTPDDQDGDCVTDSRDNCPGVPNADQIDSDGDGRGDRCDSNDDNDMWPDDQDNCRTVPNDDQARTQHPVYGDACLFDRDGDGVIDAEDNCRSRPNPDQADNDRDGAGDVCDADDDNDGILDERDNCPLNSNKNQANADGDLLGDACDPDTISGPAFVAGPQPQQQQQPQQLQQQGQGGATTVTVDRTNPRVRLSLAGRQRGSDARGGMPASVGCSEACAISARLTLSRAVAKRLKVRSVVATGEASLDAAGTTYVFLDFTRSAMKRLFRSRAVKATLTLTVRDGAGNATTARRSVRLAK